MSAANHQLVVIFEQMAMVMEILGQDRFRINAFTRAARSLESLATDVAGIGADPAALCEIDGIGKGMAQRIAEFLQTGCIKEHQELLAQLPAKLLELGAIPGLGPKTIALLWKQANITCLDDLKAKLRDDSLADLPGMGAKKIENLRKSIEYAGAAAQRVKIGVALPLARWFVDRLTRMKQVKQAAYAGSLRRGRDTIGDLDLLVAVTPADAPAVAKTFTRLEPVAQVLAQGETKVSIRTTADAGGVQVDLRLVEPCSFGAALLYFTGSKEHNIALRERAIKKKMRLNEYALLKGDQSIAGETEEQVYQALGLAWIPPELREDRGEIELAEKNAIPQLVTLDQIKAELHAHTRASDGHWSIREWAEVAIERGYHTIAVTDHSKSQVQANGLSAERLEQHIQEVRAVADEFKEQITILAGTEVDILSDGRLDYPNSLLKELDIVVASPHAALTQSPTVATARLLRAIENPYVTILGHPTGRLIGRREGLAPDISALIAAAQTRGIALEINANSWRLDLRDSHARAALDAGVKLSINTDAHGMADLDQLIYGVLTARRAGATANDIINCFDRETLKKWLAQTRGEGSVRPHRSTDDPQLANIRRPADASIPLRDVVVKSFDERNIDLQPLSNHWLTTKSGERESWKIRLFDKKSEVGTEFCIVLGELLQTDIPVGTQLAIAMPAGKPFDYRRGLLSNWLRQRLNLHWLIAGDDGTVQHVSPSIDLEYKGDAPSQQPRRFPLGPKFPREGFVQLAIEEYFKRDGFDIRTDMNADLICSHRLTGAKWVVEAKGETSATKLDMQTCFGQLMQRMDRDNVAYAVAIPETSKCLKECGMVRQEIRKKLNIYWLVVNNSGNVKVVSPAQALFGGKTM